MSSNLDDIKNKLKRIDDSLDRSNNEPEFVDEDESELVDEVNEDEIKIEEDITISGDESEESEQEFESEQEQEIKSDIEERASVYLLDDQPEGVVNYIKWSMLRGKSEIELIEEGYNSGTIRNCAAELKKEGLYSPQPKAKSQLPAVRGEVSLVKGKRAKGDLVPRDKAEKDLRMYAKGSPAEELIEHFARLPDDIRDGKGVTFESGMKFGLSVAVLGIRMAQELSNLGVSQVKPLIDMTKSMREGEVLAAKNAAREAAEETAGQIGDALGPTLQDIRTSINQQSKSHSGDPMRDMIADTMKPVFQAMTKQFMPPGTEVLSDQIASGWVKRKKK